MVNPNQAWPGLWGSVPRGYSLPMPCSVGPSVSHNLAHQLPSLQATAFKVPSQVSLGSGLLLRLLGQKWAVYKASLGLEAPLPAAPGLPSPLQLRWAWGRRGSTPETLLGASSAWRTDGPEPWCFPCWAGLKLGARGWLRGQGQHRAPSGLRQPPCPEVQGRRAVNRGGRGTQESNLPLHTHIQTHPHPHLQHHPREP